MGRYAKSRFIPIMEIPDNKIPRDPMQHPTSSDALLDMRGDMNQILTENPTATGGAWYVVKFNDATSPPTPISNAVDKYYVAFYAINAQGIIPGAKRVAAPCPPFCGNDNTRSIEALSGGVSQFVTPTDVD